MGIKNGDTVILHYTGRSANGDVFDSSQGKEPLKLTMGDGQLIEGFEESLAGRKKGEKYTVIIPAEKGYGHHVEDLIFQVPRSTFPQDITLEVGMFFQMEADESIIEAYILDIDNDKDMVTLDANHPFADEELTFEIEILDH